MVVVLDISENLDKCNWGDCRNLKILYLRMLLQLKIATKSQFRWLATMQLVFFNCL